MNGIFQKQTTPEHLAREVKERAEQAYKSAEENIINATNRVADVSKTVGVKGKKWLHSLADLVKQYPLTALAIGVASGYMLVRLAKR